MYTKNNKEILTGLEVNMQFCCPEESFVCVFSRADG